MTIKINDKDVKLKFSMRSLMLYENIQNKSFNPTTTTEILVFFYCVIMSSDKDLHFSFNEFLDMIDDNPYLMTEFSEWLTAETVKNNSLSKEQDEKKSTKKTGKK